MREFSYKWAVFFPYCGILTVALAHTVSYSTSVLGFLGLPTVFHYCNKGKAKQEKGFEILEFFMARLTEENVKDRTIINYSSHIFR